MTTITIDTYALVAKLKDSGFKEEQAKAISEAIRSIDLDHVATKQDIALTTETLRKEVAGVKIEMFKWFIPLVLGQYGLLLLILLRLGS